MKKRIYIATCIFAGIVSGHAVAEPEQDRIVVNSTNSVTAVIHGTAVTGSNDVCGERLWSYPAPFDAQPIGFSMLAEYDPEPDATSGIPLTRETCKEDVAVVSHFDPILAALGLPIPDSGLLNVKLGDMFRIANADGERTQLPRIGEVPPNPFPPVLGALSDEISLGDWLSAEGDMKLRCRANGSTRVSASYSGLIPNGMYSVWGIWITTPEGSDTPTLFASPFGGVPNAMVANISGNARFVRKLDYCPFDTSPDGSTLLYVATAYHSDNSMYGGVPEPVNAEINIIDTEGNPFSTTLSLVVHQEQVVFRIAAEILPESNPIQF